MEELEYTINIDDFKIGEEEKATFSSEYNIDKMLYDDLYFYQMIFSKKMRRYDRRKRSNKKKDKIYSAVIDKMPVGFRRLVANIAIRTADIELSVLKSNISSVMITNNDILNRIQATNWQIDMPYQIVPIIFAAYNSHLAISNLFLKNGIKVTKDIKIQMYPRYDKTMSDEYYIVYRPISKIEFLVKNNYIRRVIRKILMK